MPLREDLLNPIPGNNPSGENLRYAPIYDKIKEARREDDDAAQGEWQRERKVADYVQVMKLASEALATKSKDLQLAAWLTEAAIKREGFSGLLEGLKLIQGLLTDFWDTLYPEIDDGDLELRATPLEWLGSKFDDLLRHAPLTKAGYGFYRYKESRAVGYEEAALASDEKTAKRQQDIEDGKLTAEEWDKAFEGTSKQSYEQTVDTLDATLETLDALNDLCNEKFGDVAPGFGKLRTAVEELRHTANQFLQAKGGRNSDVQAAVEEEPAEESYAEAVPAEPSYMPASAAAAPARAPARKVVGLEPADREDAIVRLAAAARFLRTEDAYSPAPYLILRGLRWGELRAGGDEPDASLLEAPPTEIRQQLKRAAMDGSWQEVLETAETAMAMPCGRGWLDLQRYVWRAAQEMGYERIGASVRSELKALLESMPRLVEATMLDDTPTANAETQAWIKEYVIAEGMQTPRSQEEVYVPRMYEEEHAEEAVADSQNPVIDAFQLAMDAVRSGSKQEAIEILSREVVQERSGRARFHRKMQLAQVCMAVGHDNVAYPILEELADEIERLQLEHWEAPDVVAQPLALLYRCMDKVDKNSDQRQRLYAKICRLDPVQALACAR
jgi:type VI secretion system protein ImpA